MGVVYAPEQIRNGLPQQGGGDHLAAARRLMGAVCDGEVQHISALMVYGSATFGTAGIRSDLDVFARYDPNVPPSEATRSFAQVVHGINDEFHVVVEPNLKAAGPIDTPQTMDPLYIRELSERCRTGVAGGFVFGEPMMGITIPGREEICLLAVTQQYAMSKLAKFEEANSTRFNGTNYHIARRALELPGALARKILCVARGEVAVDYANSRAAREALPAASITFHDQDSVTVAFDAGARLVAIDDEITEMTQGLAKTTTNRAISSYKDLLDKLYPEICGLALDTVSAWVKVLQAEKNRD